jgi:hypothetical protein
MKIKGMNYQHMSVYIDRDGLVVFGNWRNSEYMKFIDFIRILKDLLF